MTPRKPTAKKSTRKKATKRAKPAPVVAQEVVVEPPVAVVILPTATAREILEGINMWGKVGRFSAERKYLWDVLTSLRGPDDDNTFLKQATTAVIRYHTLEHLALDRAIVRAGSISDIESGMGKYQPSWHFSKHINAAITALVVMYPERMQS